MAPFRPLSLLAVPVAAAIWASLPPLAMACANATGNQPERAAQNQGVPLPSDSSIHHGTLSNGLRFAISPIPKRTKGQDAVTFLLQIEVGSAYERDHQIGAALVAADLATSGQLSEDPEAFLRTLESFGVDRGRAIRSVATFDATRLLLTVPLQDDATLSSADISRIVELLAGIIDRNEQSIREGAIEQGSRAVLANQIAWSGPSQRLTARAIPELIENRNFADRVPIYSAGDLEELGTEAVESFVRDWYTPRRAVLVVSGPVDPQVVRMVIERSLGSLKAGEAPDEPDLTIVRPGRGVIQVESDPAVSGDIVQLILIDPPAEALDTHLAMRSRLAELVAVEGLNRRLRALSQREDTAMLQAGAYTSTETGSYRMSVLTASGDPGSWARLTREAVATIASASHIGFSEAEFEAARRSVQAALDSEAASEAQAPSWQRASIIAGQISRGDVLSSKDQLRRVGSAVLPHLRPEEVRESLASLFDPRSLGTLIVTSEEKPTTAQVAHQIETARGLDPHAVAKAVPQPDRVGILDRMPEPGSVLELSHDTEADITTALLSSGVRLHHRPMDQRPARIEIAVSLLGGAIEHTPDQTGLTEAIKALESQPATRSRTGQQIAATLAGRNISFGVRVDSESVTYQVSTTPEDFDLAMQLLHALVTQPVIEPAAFNRWRAEMLQREARARTEPAWVAFSAYQSEILRTLTHRGNDLSEAQIKAISRERASQWLDRLVASAPISVAITGDIDRTRALQSAATMFGSLPQRQPASSERFAATRNIETPRAEVTGRIHAPLATRTGAVVLGFRGADGADFEDARLLALGASILEARLQNLARRGDTVAGSVRVLSIDGEVYRGSGRFWIRSLIEPQDADRALELLRSELDLLMADGPAPDELERALRRQSQQLQRASESPRSWALALARSDGLAGEPVGALRAPPLSPEEVSPEQIAEVLSRYASCRTRTFSFVVLPSADR